MSCAATHDEVEDPPGDGDGCEPGLRRFDKPGSRAHELGDIREYEQVAVLDIDNGARFETYAIVGGPGEVCLNGAAARLVHRGDKVIVITYADYEEAELSSFVPRVVHVDSANRCVDESTARLEASGGGAEPGRLLLSGPVLDGARPRQRCGRSVCCRTTC